MSQEFDFLNFEQLESDTSAPAEAAAPPPPEHRSDPVPASGYRLRGGASLAVVDGDRAVRDYLAGLFGGEVDSVGGLLEMESRLGGSSWVVVLGPSCTEPVDLETVERWGKTHPSVATILVTSELSTQLLHKALRAGVKDVLSAPIDQAQLMETIDRVADALPQPAPFPVGPEADIAGADDGQAAKVISVFSTKGGSGKSVTATNLGVILAQRSPRPVVLIDGHMQFGDVAVMLKLQPQHTAIDALAQLDDLEPSMLERFMTVHEPSGLLVLPAPLEPTFADQITGEQVARLVQAVQGIAGHVIVDLPAIFNEVVLNVIEVSDEIMLVAGLDIPNIKNVKIGISTLQLLSVPKERLHLVLNRADSKVKLNVSEVERTLGVSAAARIPSDVVVPISVNKGSPVFLSAPKSNVARAFEQLALRFLDGEEPAEAPAASSGRRKFFG
ncbi:MAG: AAA family ATPase [Actinomycetota bacterium]